MIIDCVFRDKDICIAVEETIENVKKTRGWGCENDLYCGWRHPGATGKDRDIELISQYRSIKDQKPDDILYMGQLSGHDAVDDNDISAIYYDACMLALFMNKQWRYLTNYDFCVAFKQAKRLGFRMPTNAKKAFRRRKSAMR